MQLLLIQEQWAEKIHMNLWCLSEIGEDTIAYSDTSDYAANIEMAPVVTTYEEKSDEAVRNTRKSSNTRQKTIEEVSSFLKIEAEKCIKSLVFKVDEKLCCCISSWRS